MTVLAAIANWSVFAFAVLLWVSQMLVYQPNTVSISLMAALNGAFEGPLILARD